VSSTRDVPEATGPNPHGPQDCDNRTGCLGHVQDPISEQEFRGWFSSNDGRIISYVNDLAPLTKPVRLFNERLERRVTAATQVIAWRWNGEGAAAG
jgi:hypothetical protein